MSLMKIEAIRKIRSNLLSKCFLSNTTISYRHSYNSSNIFAFMYEGILHMLYPFTAAYNSAYTYAAK